MANSILNFEFTAGFFPASASLRFLCGEINLEESFTAEDRRGLRRKTKNRFTWSKSPRRSRAWCRLAATVHSELVEPACGARPIRIPRKNAFEEPNCTTRRSRIAFAPHPT